MNNIQVMEARYQGFWNESTMVSPAGCCPVVIQPRSLKERLVQNTYTNFMSFTIKARSPLFVCSTGFVDHL